MERLTNKREADAQRKEYKNRIGNGYPRNIPEERFLRLAAYEDTGLTPEQVEELAHDTTGPLHRKIGEWIEAEAAGRLEVLPCKVGDTLWAADTTPVTPLHVMAVAFFLEGKDGGYYERLSNVGKSVFLTREEAETALKG